MESQRGQTFPVWTFGILTILMLMFMVLDYAESLRWQIRAQNAADSVAQASLSVQASEFNELLMTMHAAGIEEWRLRKTLNALMMVVQGSGGCYDTFTATYDSLVDTTRDCATVYNNLRANYINDLNHYSADVAMMSQISLLTATKQQADITGVFNALTTTNCGKSVGAADCSLGYTLLPSGGATQRSTTNISGAYDYSGIVNNGDGAPLPNVTNDLLPLQLEVVACAKLEPLWASFFKLNVPPTTVIGRAAATTVQATQEWLAVGTEKNPGTGQYFQPVEYPEQPVAAVLTAPAYGGAYDWYEVNYGSSKWTVQGGTDNPYYLSFGAVTDEYSPMTGWCRSIQAAPFVTNLTTAQWHGPHGNE